MSYHLKKALKWKWSLTFINFIKQGESGTTQAKPGGMLSTSEDWNLKVDLHQQLIFPSEIAATTLRPDAVVVKIV